MDYKKKLALAKEALDSGSYDKETIEYIFPELKESKDERIRKELIQYLYQLGAADNREYINWLEKQGEQKPTISDEALREGIIKFGITQYQIDNWLKKHLNVVEQKPILDVEMPFGAKDSELEEVTYDIPKGYHADIEDDKVVIKQGEQKPVTIDIDKMVDVYRNTDEYDEDGNLKGKPVNCMIRAYEQGLNDAIEKVVLKPAWSEEDEKMLDDIIEASTHHCYLNITDINWLNSLKDRVQC